MGKLDKIRQQIEKCRRKSDVRHKDLSSIAKALGRKRDTSRGKEPTYVSDRDGWLPVSIPDHPKPFKTGTKHNILDQLEDDLARLEEELKEEEESP